MTFERFWCDNGHGLKHGGTEYNLAKLAWNAAIAEAAKAVISKRKECTGNTADSMCILIAESVRALASAVPDKPAAETRGK
jgi:hypothetical protein